MLQVRYGSACCRIANKYTSIFYTFVCRLKFCTRLIIRLRLILFYSADISTGIVMSLRKYFSIIFFNLFHLFLMFFYENFIVVFRVDVLRNHY
jgi:hypothetical protein